MNNTIFGAKKKVLMLIDGEPYYICDCSTQKSKYDLEKKPKKRKKK